MYQQYVFTQICLNNMYSHKYVSTIRIIMCTGWRRLTGCLKLQVIFCKWAIDYRAFLQKMTYKKPFYASSPPSIIHTNKPLWSDSENLVNKSFICGTRLTHMCDMTHSHFGHKLFVCVTWLTHMCVVIRSYVWHDSFMSVTHSCVCRKLFHCLKWLHFLRASCDMTHPYVWHDSFTWVMWQIPTCDTTHFYIWHDTFIRVTWLIHMSLCFGDSRRRHKCTNIHLAYAFILTYTCLYMYMYMYV